MRRFFRLSRRTGREGLDEQQASLRKAVCSSFVRAMRRHGMTGRAEIKQFEAPDKPPAMFVTVERAAVKLSQASLAMLSREIVAHAQRKYATTIVGVYWRIEADYDSQDEPDGDVFGPTTQGYLVEESSILDGDLAAMEKMLHEAESKLAVSEHVLSQATQFLSTDISAQQLLDKTSRRREERRVPKSGQDPQTACLEMEKLV